MTNLFRNFSIIKICDDLVFIIFCFSFQILFFVDWFLIKFSFNTIVDIILGFIICFKQLIISNQKSDIFSFMKTFYISSYFLKRYKQWINFIIIIFVINNKFMSLFIKETLFDMDILSLSTSSIEIRCLVCTKKFAFVNQMLKVLYSYFILQITKNNFSIIFLFPCATIVFSILPQFLLMFFRRIIVSNSSLFSFMSFSSPESFM